MTPKEKAKELVDRFRENANGLLEPTIKRNSKQCAIICVDEILSLRMINNMGRDDKYNEAEFYTEVKQEIEKA